MTQVLYVVERVTGIGPVTQPWEGHVLPLDYTRTSLIAFIFMLGYYIS